MIQINLLPWREETRKLNKIRFFIWLGIFIALSLIFLLLFHMKYSLSFSHQQQLNDLIKNEINQEQTALTDLTQQQNTIQGIKDHLNFISDLKKQSFQSILLMNELASLVPRAVSLNKIIRIGNKITLIGVGKTNADLTAFKTAIAKSRIFNQPSLTEVSSENSLSINFTLDVEQKDVL